MKFLFLSIAAALFSFIFFGVNKELGFLVTFICRFVGASITLAIFYPMTKKNLGD